MSPGELRRLVRLVVTDATSGIPLITGAIVAASALLLGSSARVANFQPGWADPLNYALTATAFLGPLAVGAAAIHLSYVVRSGMADLAETSARGRRGSLLLALAAVLLWQLVTLMVLLAVLLIRADLAGAGTPAMGLLALLAVSVVTACTVVGAVVGSRWTSPLAPPTLAVSCFLWIYGISFYTGKVARLSPIYPNVFYQDWYQPHRLLVASQAGVLLACALLAGAALYGSRAGVWLVGVAVLGLAVSAGGWVRASASATEYRPLPAYIPCRTSMAISLCVWPESQFQIDPALRALTLVHDRLSPYTLTPTSYAETGLTRAFPEATTYQMPSHTESDYVYYAVLAAVSQPLCQNHRVVSAQLALTDMYLTRVTGQPTPNTNIARLLRSQTRHIVRWVSSRLSILDSCGR